jgi:hypothetical protein
MMTSPQDDPIRARRPLADFYQPAAGVSARSSRRSMRSSRISIRSKHRLWDESSRRMPLCAVRVAVLPGTLNERLDRGTIPSPNCISARRAIPWRA